MDRMHVIETIVPMGSHHKSFECSRVKLYQGLSVRIGKIPKQTELEHGSPPGEMALAEANAMVPPTTKRMDVVETDGRITPSTASDVDVRAGFVWGAESDVNRPALLGSGRVPACRGRLRCTNRLTLM